MIHRTLGTWYIPRWVVPVSNQAFQELRCSNVLPATAVASTFLISEILVDLEFDEDRRMSNSKPPGLTLKLVLLGDGRVGKTSLVLRYVNNVFSEKQEATVQASYLTKRLVVEGVPITLAIWDTAGQERFHALGPIYYRDADAALLVYDIMDNDSFIRVRNWVKELQRMASKNIVMAIAANKNDLVRSRKIDLQEAESYSTSIGAKFFVTSAKLGTGIDDLFLDIATRVLLLKRSTGDLSPAPPRKGMLIIDDEPEKEQQMTCCS